jgi:hypothetical protein
MAASAQSLTIKQIVFKKVWKICHGLQKRLALQSVLELNSREIQHESIAAR